MYFLERALDNTNHFGKLILLAFTFVFGSFIGMIPLIVAMVTADSMPLEFLDTLDFSLFGISKNTSLLLNLLPFVVALFACILVVKKMHARSFSETVNGTRKVRWNRAFVGFGVWGLFVVAVFFVEYTIDPNNFVLQFDVKTFLPLLFISLLFIPLQTTCEEFIFRGYLTQNVAAWTKNRWLAIIIPGLLFGLMHSCNPEITEYGFWAAMPSYIIFGLIFGLVSVLDDGIELAMGMHAANNILACLLVTFKGSALVTPAIFYAKTIDVNMSTISTAVFGILAVLFFAWKYKWNFHILNRKVKPLPSTEEETMFGL
ncbi:MAG: CPBP family intramembrane metalloprotease [Bacteroidales bacterium]|jgi:membrane protease YdiL (CAAX protease family)|nr:CPBP family intramembrane metalloprotease [Bacteroidales bacterium]